MADMSNALARVPLFAGVRDRDRKRLAKMMSERTFTEGEQVMAEGQTGVGFFVIEEGDAMVSVGGNLVRTLGPGEFFGEIALIDQGPRTASVTAATDLRCQGLAAWEFRSFIQEHPEVAWPMLENLAQRLRETQARGQT